MIRLPRSEYSTKNVISEIQEIVEDLKKDFLRSQSQLGKKNKQLNQYQKTCENDRTGVPETCKQN